MTRRMRQSTTPTGDLLLWSWDSISKGENKIKNTGSSSGVKLLPRIYITIIISARHSPERPPPSFQIDYQNFTRSCSFPKLSIPPLPISISVSRSRSSNWHSKLSTAKDRQFLKYVSLLWLRQMLRSSILSFLTSWKISNIQHGFTLI